MTAQIGVGSPWRNLLHRKKCHGLPTPLLAGALAIATTIGCGRSTSNGPSTSPTPTPGNPTSTTTITITLSGVSPKAIIVPRGGQVTFINNDTVSHDMASDPHPEHTDCPEINQAGFLVPGQSRQTGNLNTARVCGYHDHDRNTVQALQGTITIQ